jgi:OmpA-OmpF porin, OOP family
MLERVKRTSGGMAAIVIVLSSASCATVVHPPSQATACSWATSPPAEHQPAVSSDTAVLVDITASFWPKAGQQLSLPDDPVMVAVNSLLRNFATAGTRLVSFGTFDGSSATVDWKLSDVALPTPTGDSTDIQSEQQSAETCMTNVVKSAITAAPQAPGTDVMAALAAAGQQLQGAQPPDDQVVLITDGLSNTGCLSLSSVISQGKSASAVLSSCPERAGLALLHGVDLQLVGVGFQAALPPLDTAEQAWVEGYWSDMCAALHVASAASCVAPATSDSTRVSVNSHLSDPAIQFPSVPENASSVPVPADLLFAFDSSQLSADGQAYLAILSGELKTQGRTITRVIGHTDAVGTASYNLGLSQRRADAVRDYLAAHGFAGVTAAGAGEADPACSPQYTATGVPIESCMAQDRRVQIMLGG